MNLKLLALFFSCLLFAASFGQNAVPESFSDAAADDSELLEEEEVVISSPDVETAAVFPDFPEKKITTGGIVELLLGFTNNGQKKFNVSGIDASLNYPIDFSVYIQNFTKAPYGIVVEPSEIVSFAYRFWPDQMLEPRDFGFLAHVYYADEDGVNYTTTFFNSTIILVEAESTFNLELFFVYVGIFGVIGLGCFLGYKAYSSFAGPSRRRRKIDSGTVRDTKLDNEWLEGTNVHINPGRKTSPKSPTNNQKRSSSR